MIREFGDCGPFIEYYDEKKHKELNSSQFVCVLFPLTEHLTLVTVSERVKLAIYDTVIIKNGIPWSLDADCSCMFYYLTLPKDIFSQYAFNKDISIISASIPSAAATLIKNLMLRLVICYIDNNYTASLQSEAILWKICDHIATARLTKLSLNNDDQNDTSTITKILGYINNHFNDPDLSLTELADHFSFSREHISRLFKKSTSIGFKEYLTNTRLENAAFLLTASDDSIMHIAMNCGFPSIGAFNSAFKKKYNEIPATYRKKHTGHKRLTISDPIDDEIVDGLRHTMTSSENSFISDRLLAPKLNVINTEVSAATVQRVSFPWKELINAGQISMLANAENQSHLLQMCNELGFKYIRLEGIFQNIELHQDGTFTINYNNIDAALAFLSEHALKPYLLIGPKPLSILSHIGANERHQHLYTSDYSNINLLDPDRLTIILDSLLRHLISRFGQEEINTWIFESWCPDPWNHYYYNNWDTIKAFEVLYKVVKRFAPDALVGGSEFKHQMHHKMVRDLAEHCIRNNCMPDFISYSFFPYEISDESQANVVKASDFKMNRSVATDPDFFRHQLESMHQEMTDVGFNNIPLHISLFSITASSRLDINDSCYKGAWMIKNLLDSVGKVSMVGYWIASDIYSMYTDLYLPLIGAPGLVSSDNIRKPSFYSLSFLNRISNRVIKEDKNYIVTKHSDGQYSCLVYNLVQTWLPSQKSGTAHVELTNFFKDTPVGDIGSCRVQIKLTDIPSGKYLVRQRSISRTNGSVSDILDEWPENSILSTSDIDYLRSICIPLRKMLTLESKNNALELGIDLIDNEFSLITLDLIL